MHSLTLLILTLAISLSLPACSKGGKSGPTDMPSPTTPAAPNTPSPPEPGTGPQPGTPPDSGNGKDPNSAPTPTAVYLATGIESLTVVLLVNAEAETIKFVTPTNSVWRNLELIPFGNYTATSITDMHLRSALYTLDGKIFSINLRKSDSANPVAVQVSNEDGATKICNTFLNPDFANHANSGFLYELPGVDNDCLTVANNQWKLVRLSMSATDSPTPVSARPILALDDIATGAAATGWLAQAGNELSHYDANFIKLHSVATATSAVDRLSAARDFVIVDNKLYHYSQATTTLSSVLHDFTSNAIGKMNLSDGEFDYFQEKTPTETKIFRIRADGSQSAEFLASEAGSIAEYALTLNRLFYTVRAGATTTLKSLSKVAPFSPVDVPLGISGAPTNLAARATKLYYNIEPVDPAGTYYAGSLDENGSNDAKPNSRWVGLSFETTVTQAASNEVISKFILLDGYDPASRKFISATLTSYNAQDGTLIARLGTLSTSVDKVSFNPEFGDSTVGFAYSGSKVDVYLIKNLTTPDTLVRLTGSIP